MGPKGKEFVKGERDLEAVTSPGRPGSLYMLDWETFGCNQTPNLFANGAGWEKDYRDWAENEPYDVRPFRIACPPNEPVRSGQRSARFYLRNTDPIQSGSKRAELKGKPVEPVGAERWYGFSIYLHEWANDPAPDIVTQSHHEPGTGSPPLSIGTKAGYWVINVPTSWDYNDTKQETAIVYHTPYQSNTWTDWVVYAKWSSGADGVVKVWKDGQPEPVYREENAQNAYSGVGNYMKIGIYKWPWRDATTNSPPQQRVMYHDEVRIAEGEAGTDKRDLVAPPARPRLLTAHAEPPLEDLDPNTDLWTGRIVAKDAETDKLVSGDVLVTSFSATPTNHTEVRTYPTNTTLNGVAVWGEIDKAREVITWVGGVEVRAPGYSPIVLRKLKVTHRGRDD